MNTQELINALRSTQSRSKRALLGAAADTIEALLEELRVSVPCLVCGNDKQIDQCTAIDYDCDSCLQPCLCHTCGPDLTNFEWRGIPEKEAET